MTERETLIVALQGGMRWPGQPLSNLVALRSAARMLDADAYLERRCIELEMQRAADQARIGELQLACVDAACERARGRQEATREHLPRVKELERMVETLTEDQRRLDSGCIMFDSRDELGQPTLTMYERVDLRAAIDRARKA